MASLRHPPLWRLVIGLFGAIVATWQLALYIASGAVDADALSLAAGGVMILSWAIWLPNGTGHVHPWRVVRNSTLYLLVLLATIAILLSIRGHIPRTVLAYSATTFALLGSLFAFLFRKHGVATRMTPSDTAD